MKDINKIADGLVKGNRRMLGKAITMVESRNPSHRRGASDLLEQVLPKAGKSIRIGITGNGITNLF